MLRSRVLFGVLTLVGAAAFSVPALAKTHHARSHGVLVMSTHLGRRIAPLHKRSALIGGPMLPPQAVPTFQGYTCEATVSYGGTGQHTFNPLTTDSTQFYIPFVVGSSTYNSVTSNCIGVLPSSKIHPTSIVTHKLTSCEQFSPFNQAKVIQGSGISTTFPDGLYSETCNTPSYHP